MTAVVVQRLVDVLADAAFHREMWVIRRDALIAKRKLAGVEAAHASRTDVLGIR